MDLPPAVASLVTAVLDVAPDAILLTQSGTPFSMLPWADLVKTHLHAWFGGNELGNGIADVLFGVVNPSGKLPLSFPRRIEDTPTYLNFGSERGQVTYGEGIYVGYKLLRKSPTSCALSIRVRSAPVHPCCFRSNSLLTRFVPQARFVVHLLCVLRFDGRHRVRYTECSKLGRRGRSGSSPAVYRGRSNNVVNRTSHQGAQRISKGGFAAR